MASSTASPGGYSRRRPNARRQPISRTSSLFGAIRNIVTAPLSWFSSTDDFEDSTDSTGKRRRLAAAPTELNLDGDDRPSRTKRMRVDSPPRQAQPEGYLDPPVAAFRQPQSIGRAASAGAAVGQRLGLGTAGSYARSRLSPLRNSQITRTMSIDPPQRLQSYDGGVIQSQRSLDTDASMESLPPLPPISTASTRLHLRSSLSVPRDLSMPYARPPFRMRTSLTPQPRQITREKSEPPPLQSLISHPTFVRPPPVPEEPRTSPADSMTLGSLVDSVRRSPNRRHSSLLFGKSEPEPKPSISISPAQQALHELEIYKTPLLPTRLRTGQNQSSITGMPDLFKPRRHKLELMKEEKRATDRRLGRKEAMRLDKNNAKPYAGEGGMKKLLAKRKLELEEGEEGVEAKRSKVEEETQRENGKAESPKSPPTPSETPVEVPPLPKTDWYSLASASSGNTGGSSLRVGRAKTTRNHIPRPVARIGRSKFSAKFEDEVDETMDEAADKEKEMIEEAAKKASVFQVPPSFSFSKDVKPIEQDINNAKEPPLKSLPFSLIATPAPAPPIPAAPERKEEAKDLAQSTSAPPSTSLPFSLGPPSTTAQEKPTSLFGPPSTATIQAPSAPSASTTNGGVPNFFAHSSIFNKPLEIKTPPLDFGSKSEPPKAETPSKEVVPFGEKALSTTSTSTSLFGSPVPSATPTDTGKKAPEGLLKPAFFSIPTEQKEQSPQPLMNGEVKTVITPIVSKEATKPPSTMTSGFSFAPRATDSLTKPSLSFAPASVAPAPSLFGQSISKPAAEEGPKPTIPTPGFAPTTTNLVSSAPASDVSKPSLSPFGTETKPTPSTEPTKPSPLFGPSSAGPIPAFTFGQSKTSAAPVEAPKPVSSNLFSFDTSTQGAKSVSPAPFTFGTPEKEKASSPAPFSFGAPATPTAQEKVGPSFTFGTPSANAAPPGSSLFSFGAKDSTAVGTSKASDVVRPVTPPKNHDQDQTMDESPTRDTRQLEESKPSFGGFSFGGTPTTGSVLFGGQPTGATTTTTTSAPFSFGSTPSPNPFAPQAIKETKSEEGKPFAFGQSTATATASSGFSFGQPQTAEVPRPSTAGSFNFSGATPTTTASPFNFGAAPTGTTFGQSTGGSAPSSPSTFQPAFSFGTPTNATSAPFTFGSQPASPAGGASALPGSAPVTFGGGGTGFGSAPSSPFSAPTQIAPSTSGGTLFNIGAAPPPQTNPQGRAIKRLPNRTRKPR